MQENKMEILAKIFEIVKSMKCSVDDMVVVNGNHIVVRSGIGRIAIADLPYDTGIHNIFIYKSLNKYLSGDYSEPLINQYLTPKYYEIMELYSKYMAYSSPIYVDNNFKENHSDVFDLKTNNGYIKMNIAGHNIISFAGNISTSKKDTVTLYAFLNENPGQVVMRYDIYKDKFKAVITVFNLHLDLKMSNMTTKTSC